jgi:hypothetical protein
MELISTLGTIYMVLFIGNRLVLGCLYPRGYTYCVLVYNFQPYILDMTSKKSITKQNLNSTTRHVASYQGPTQEAPRRVVFVNSSRARIPALCSPAKGSLRTRKLSPFTTQFLSERMVEMEKS